MGHLAKDCYYLYPNKAPKGYFKGNNKIVKSKKPNKKIKNPYKNSSSSSSSSNNSIEEEEVYNIDNISIEEEKDNTSTTKSSYTNSELDYSLVEVAIPIIPYINNISNNYLLGPIKENIPFIKTKPFLSYNNKNTYKFLYNTGATKHIVFNKNLLINYKNINKKVL
jgi:hypothetical protein